MSRKTASYKLLNTSIICKALLVACMLSQNIPIALSADLPTRSYDSSYASPTNSNIIGNWTGFYAGAHVGYGFSHSSPAKLDGFALGIDGGFNYQINRVVLGGELDIGYSFIDYRAFSETFRQKWLGSARGKLGYSFEQFLPFISAGVAYTSATMKSGGSKDDNSHTGLVLGLGGEMMMTDHISANLQFLHYRFSSQKYNVSPVRNADIITNEIRLGANYKF